MRRLTASGTSSVLLRRLGPFTVSVVLAGLALAVMATLTPSEAELRGHGGPVRALAISPDGRTALSGSFDQSAILWSLERGAALAVLRFHAGAVNAAASLSDGRFATGGEDGRIAIWQPGAETPARVVEGHSAPVVGLAVSPDGRLLASAAWDGTARLTPLAGGDARVLEGHQGNVNAVAFLSDGRVATAGYDATIRLWPGEGGTPVVTTLASPLNSLLATPDGKLIAAAADGTIQFVNGDGAVGTPIEIAPAPLIAVALSPDARTIAAASIGGSVAVIERASGKVRFNLVGPGMPVWSLAFLPGGKELLTGGSDRVIRRWDLDTGEPIGPLAMARPEDFLQAFKGERGAELFQACAACHTLTPDGGNRAGPTLHALFGRKIATAPGYNFSEAFKRLNIVWTPETVSKLFELGPQRFTPGTKMPEQVITDPEDRAALVRFLERATGRNHCASRHPRAGEDPETLRLDQSGSPCGSGVPPSRE